MKKKAFFFVVESFMLVVYYTTRALAMVMPPRALFAFYSLAGRALYGLRRGVRRDLLRKIGEALPRETDEPRLAEIAKGAYTNMLLPVTDLTLFNRHPERYMSELEIEGLENYDCAISKGNGVLIMAMHFGPAHLIHAIMARIGREYSPIIWHPSNTPVPRYAMKMDLLGNAAGCDPDKPVIWAGEGYDTIGETREHLARGGRAGMTIDVPGKCLVDFFGRPAALADGIAHFAYDSGAPIVPVCLLRRPGAWKVRMVVGEPIEVEKKEGRKADVRAAMRKVAAAGQAQVELAPEQYWSWFGLWGLWERGDRLAEKEGRESVGGETPAGAAPGSVGGQGLAEDSAGGQEVAVAVGERAGGQEVAVAVKERVGRQAPGAVPSGAGGSTGIDLGSILQCPDCGAGVCVSPGLMTCEGCGRLFAVRRELPDMVHCRATGETREEGEHYSGKIDYYLGMQETWEESPFYRHYHSVILNWAAGNGGRLVLEVGCGLGNDSLRLLERGCSVVACDVSAAELEKAREMHEEAGYGAGSAHVLADAQSLPFKDSVFDAVMMVATLHHLSDPEAGLAEACRVLSPGGTLVLGTEPASWQHRVLFPLGKAVLNAGYRLSGNGRVPDEHVSEADKRTDGFSRRELEKALLAGGFSEVRVVPAGMLSASLFFIGQEMQEHFGRTLRLFAAEAAAVRLEEALARRGIGNTIGWHWNAKGTRDAVHPG